MSENGRLEKLLGFLNESPHDSFLKFALAKEYESANLLNKALNYYTSIKNDDPEYTGLYYHLGKLYEQIEEPHLGLETYKIGIEIAKKQGDFHAVSELNNAKMNLEIELNN